MCTMKENEEIIPENYTGRTINTDRVMEFDSMEEASVFFE